MNVVVSSTPNSSEKCLIFHNTYDHVYRDMAKKWCRAYYNQEVRFTSAVKCKTGPQVLILLLDQRRNYYYYYYIIFTILQGNISKISPIFDFFSLQHYKIRNV